MAMPGWLAQERVNAVTGRPNSAGGGAPPDSLARRWNSWRRAWRRRREARKTRATMTAIATRTAPRETISRPGTSTDPKINLEGTSYDEVATRSNRGSEDRLTKIFVGKSWDFPSPELTREFRLADKRTKILEDDLVGGVSSIGRTDSRSDRSKGDGEYDGEVGAGEDGVDRVDGGGGGGAWGRRPGRAGRHHNVQGGTFGQRRTACNHRQANRTWQTSTPVCNSRDV